jgi:hypothetical protein
MKINGIENYAEDQIIKNKITIDNLNQLTKYFQKIFYSWYVKTEYNKTIKENITFDIIVEALKNILNTDLRLFKSEEEWIVKDKVLKVPKHSTLIIIIPNIPKQTFNNWKLNNFSKEDILSWQMRQFHEILTSIKEYDLNNKYKIKLLSKDGLSVTREKYAKYKKRKNENGN